MAESMLSKLKVLTDTLPEDKTLPAFVVSTPRGFLPRQDPVVKLPPEFDPLESLLTRMPIQTSKGTDGLLATGELGDAVLRELPDLTSAIETYQNDLPLMNALYRDYSFLASAYLLEPCHQRFIRGEPYGLGRALLPRTIAAPIVKVAEM
jgi:indoleamine 2,3-dioxygenase